MIRILAVYPNDAGSRFDGDYYRHRHAPFACRLLAPFGLDSVRTVLGEAALDGTSPAYWAVSEMLFATRAAFDEAMAQCGAALFADLPNYTTVTPVLQVGTLAEEDIKEGA